MSNSNEPHTHEGDDRIRIGTETENQGPIGLLISVLRERLAGGRY